MRWMLMPLRRYADFQGRSRRKEFWLWVLFVILASVVLSALDAAFGLGGETTFDRTNTLNSGSAAYNFGYNFGAMTRTGILSGIFSLAILLPNLAVQVRRLHDTDRSGWWLLLPVGPYLVGAVMIVMAMIAPQAALIIAGAVLVGIGVICAIVLLVFLCLPGTSGRNRFGPDPLAPDADLARTFG
ncbi:DUF805 domain-containing protein [uncultured Sphingomonas sp.]|uniref:DUF805 domain-containing protein n=1 Tax=uncultured Sphingomonas sp. TaxID=158754 RepID=UPI0035CB03D6